MFDYQAFMDALCPLRRDIVSDGYDRALEHIRAMLPAMKVHAYASGSAAWTWTIPEKWTVDEAWIRQNGKIIVDMAENPLHVMSYAAPVCGRFSREELFRHLHSREDQPSQVPFEYSYYKRNWGFCVQHDRLGEFTADEYEVRIDSRFEPGQLKVGEVFIPGESTDEVVVMAHLCHPCMADDGLSGVAVIVAMARAMAGMPRPRLSRRFLILPETIGSIAYLSHNEEHIGNMVGGVFLDMLGHADAFSLQRSRQGDSVLDKAAELAFRDLGLEPRVGEFGKVVVNDEMVLNGPGVDVPSISLSRSRFWIEERPYPEYHSSADSMDIVSVENLAQSQAVLERILGILDENYAPRPRCKGPIFLSRYGLWVDWREDRQMNLAMEDFFYLMHKGMSLVDIAAALQVSFAKLKNIADQLAANGLLDRDFNFSRK